MPELLPYLITGLVSFAVGVALILMQPKAKLVYWSPHSFLFNLTQQNVVLQTDALTLQNLGRRTARNVDIVLSGKPDFFQFAPAINHDSINLDNDQYVLRIAELGPKEVITLQVLSYTKVPNLLNIRSDAGTAQSIRLQFQRVLPAWLNVLASALLLIGLGTVLYWIIVGVMKLYSCASGCGA